MFALILAVILYSHNRSWVEFVLMILSKKGRKTSLPIESVWVELLGDIGRFTWGNSRSV